MADFILCCDWCGLPMQRILTRFTQPDGGVHVSAEEDKVRERCFMFPNQCGSCYFRLNPLRPPRVASHPVPIRGRYCG